MEGKMNNQEPNMLNPNDIDDRAKAHPIVDVVELATDEPDEVKYHFSVRVEYQDGSNGRLTFSLSGGRAMRAILDTVPELDGEKW
jgi:hypothetical protein